MATIKRLQNELLCKKQDCSFTELAQEYGVNRWYLYMIMYRDYVPTSLEVRRNLGLIRPRPRRVAIHCTDMQSAADTITNNLDPAKVREMVVLLEKG